MSQKRYGVDQIIPMLPSFLERRIRHAEVIDSEQTLRRSAITLEKGVVGRPAGRCHRVGTESLMWPCGDASRTTERVVSLDSPNARRGPIGGII